MWVLHMADGRSLALSLQGGTPLLGVLSKLLPVEEAEHTDSKWAFLMIIYRVIT